MGTTIIGVNLWLCFYPVYTDTWYVWVHGDNHHWGELVARFLPRLHRHLVCLGTWGQPSLGRTCGYVSTPSTQTLGMFGYMGTTIIGVNLWLCFYPDYIDTWYVWVHEEHYYLTNTVCIVSLSCCFLTCVVLFKL